MNVIELNDIQFYHVVHIVLFYLLNFQKGETIMKEVTKEIAVEMFGNMLSLLSETNEDMLMYAAEVAAAKEKYEIGAVKTKKAVITLTSKLDHTCDSFKDQVMDMFLDMIADDIKKAKSKKDKKTIEMVKTLADEAADIILNYCKKTAIISATLAIDTVYHKEKCKFDKEEMKDAGLEFKAAVYSFAEKFFSFAVEELGKEVDDEAKETYDFVISTCEDNITDLRSQISGKKKVNPIVRNPEEVKQIAKKTEVDMQTIKALEVTKDFREVAPQSGQGEPGSFIKASKYYTFNA